MLLASSWGHLYVKLAWTHCTGLQVVDACFAVSVLGLWHELAAMAAVLTVGQPLARLSHNTSWQLGSQPVLQLLLV